MRLFWWFYRLLFGWKWIEVNGVRFDWKELCRGFPDITERVEYVHRVATATRERNELLRWWFHEAQYGFEPPPPLTFHLINSNR